MQVQKDSTGRIIDLNDRSKLYWQSVDLFHRLEDEWRHAAGERLWRLEKIMKRVGARNFRRS